MTIYRDNNLPNVSLYRFHLKRYLSASLGDLAHLFVDKPFLVEQEARYSGADVNPGWFFSLSRNAAVREMGYRLELEQGINVSTAPEILTSCRDLGDERVLITCKASLSRVLNLIWLPILRDVIQSCFEHVTGWPYADAGSILLALADEEICGNPMTDVIGRFAFDAGYEGVRYPSARALEQGGIAMFPGAPLRDRLEHGAVELTGYASYEFDDLLWEINHQAANVVVFRGAYLAHCITESKIDFADRSTSGWIKNIRHNAPIPEIQSAIEKAGGISEGEMRDLCFNNWERMRPQFADHGWQWGPLHVGSLKSPPLSNNKS